MNAAAGTAPADTTEREPGQDGEEQKADPNDDIADGYYDAFGVEGSDVMGVSDNGNEQVAVEVRLIDLNRTVITILNFAPKAEAYSLDRLRALGWKGGDSLAGIGTNKVQVRAKREYWADKQTGAQRSKVKFEIMTGGRFAFAKPMDDTQKRGFFARLNQLAEQGGGAGKGGAPAGGYPADWDKTNAPAPTGGAPPRVDLG